MLKIEESGVLIIIGNGHNLALGFRTTYRDFASHYLSRDSSKEESALYSYLCREFSIDNWCDLEYAIKKYALSYNLVNNTICLDREYFAKLIHHMGFFMDGEVKYQFLCNHISEKESFQQSLPVFMFNTMLGQDRHYKVLSFNYSNLDYILDDLAKDIVYPTINRALSLDEERYLKSYVSDRVDVEYVHITGSRCILGIDNDERIPPDLNFLKKSYQFLNSTHYPVDFSNYHSIIVYGHSLGETDSDFLKSLFDGVLSRKRECNPKLIFITKDEKGQNLVLSNLVRHLGNLSEVQRHLDYEFILDDPNAFSDVRSSVLKALICK